MMTDQQQEELIQRADAIGIRLEIIAGLPVWEASPAARHQKALFRIQTSFQPLPGSTCSCFTLADTLIRFPDGSLKRPDIAVFCQEPPDTDEALECLPEAVVEILSTGYEAKDLELGSTFYLAQGVKDIIVLDPRTSVVRHLREGDSRQFTAPAEIVLECGCRCCV
jgi:Uma2 family endonuclease